MGPKENAQPPKRQRTLLLFILGYEALGCLFGGILLVIAPDGSLLKMPVSLMHGVFPDFLFPGLILFGLGLLNLAAWTEVFFRRNSDWLTTGPALGGLFVWFVVEIMIIREIHWLHAMWGIPVLIGLVIFIRDKK